MANKNLMTIVKLNMDTPIGSKINFGINDVFVICNVRMVVSMEVCTKDIMETDIKKRRRSNVVVSCK